MNISLGAELSFAPEIKKKRSRQEVEQVANSRAARPAQRGMKLFLAGEKKAEHLRAR